MKILLLTSLLFLSACSSSDSGDDFTVPGDGEVTYKITFDMSWSASTHPDGFPSNPHFSGIIGASHNVNVSLWQDMELASAGIESMAETGNKDLLRSEINTQIEVGDAEKLISGGGIGSSPGSITFTLPMNSSHSFVTVVSMLAPSPDWFVGVSSLNLMDNGVWIENKTIDLYAYDAGTDDGVSYESANQDSSPKQAVAKITSSPFLVDGNVVAVGQLIIQRL